MSISDKKTAQILSSVFKSYGIKDIVISPGSRNAPLIITFAGDDFFNCLTIVDERSAGFFALGMAVEKKRPVALVCTSGSALLNYAPAVSEAYYRHIPLVVVSADRPVELIDQGDGQTIHQAGALDEHVNYSCTLPSGTSGDDDVWYVNRLINETLINCNVQKQGPVHINIPFKEPLYGKEGGEGGKTRVVSYMKPQFRLDKPEIEELAEIWNSADNVLILLGETDGNEKLERVLREVGDKKQAVVLTETLTNVTGQNIFCCIDSMISTITEDEAAVFRPDLLITTDGPVVSKMVKTFLRNNPPKYHWNVTVSEPLMDTYKHLTHSIPLNLEDLLGEILPELKEEQPRYFDFWKHRFEAVSKYHSDYINTIPWSDLKVFEVLHKNIPEGYTAHWGNSSIVRYAQLFEKYYGVRNFSNRGTSGIDGSVSTAAGAAFASERNTLLVTGDLSFMYDSNGLWNKYLSPKLKIIVVNNGGGGIFRFIPGPSDSGYLEEFFEAGHSSRSVSPLAKMYGLEYIYATNEEELKNRFKEFFEEKESPVILEVITPAKENAKVLRRYFEYLKEIR